MTTLSTIKTDILTLTDITDILTLTDMQQINLLNYIFEILSLSLISMRYC